MPEALYGRALSLFANYNPTVFNDAMQFRANGLRGVISGGRLDNDSTTRWYLCGSPDEVDLFERAQLAGNENPTFEQEELFNIDGIAYKLSIRFGFAISDYRAIVRVG